MKLFKRLLKYFSRLEKEEIIDLTPIVEDKYNEVAIGNLVKNKYIVEPFKFNT